MNKKNLLERAFLSAVGVVLYVVLLAWFMNNLHNWFESDSRSWLNPALFLMAFIISACITASLVLLKPILLYVEGQKKEAVHLFSFTLGFLVLLAILIGLLVLYN